MTHWSKTTGTAAVIAMYVVQAGMILWGPPPVKAAGISWALLPIPADTIFVFGLGYALGSGIGHSEDEISKVDVFTGLVEVFSEPECDPFHPDWTKRCLKVEPFI